VHVLAVRDVREDHATLAIYVNGSLAVDAPLVATGRLLGIDVEQDPLMVGASIDYDPSVPMPAPKHHYKGVIDELSLYGTPLGAAEAKRLHDAGASGKCQP
jgi:hypothetical protein